MGLCSALRNRGGVLFRRRLTRLVLLLALSTILVCVSFQTCEAARNISVDHRKGDAPWRPEVEFFDDERVHWEEMWAIREATLETWMVASQDEVEWGTGYDPSFHLRLNFRGTAIYLYYPLWPTQASTGMISIDGSPPVAVDLQDRTYFEPPDPDRPKNMTPTKRSEIRYFRDSLFPGNHTLVISALPRAGREEIVNPWVVFDSLVYTELESDNPDFTTTSSSESTSSSPETTSSTPEATLPPTPTPQSQNSKKVAIIAACTSVLLAALLALALFIICRKRRRQRRGTTPYDLSEGEPDPKIPAYDGARVALAPPSGHDASYRGAEECASSPSSAFSPPSNTHHNQPSAEALLQQDATAEGRGILAHKAQGTQNDRETLHVRNRVSTMIATEESGTAPPPYESLLHSTHLSPPVPEKSPVILQYPGSSRDTATTSTRTRVENLGEQR